LGIDAGVLAVPVPSALRERRLLQGWSQDQLARRAGVSRQALNALERGHAQPSVETALSLARLLGTTVEALFGASPRAQPTLPAHAGPPGTRLLLAEVGGRVHAHVLDPSSGEPADALVELDDGPPALLEPERWRRTLLVAGCDPALRLLAMRAGNARWLEAGTGRAVDLLFRRQVHLAGVHSLTERDRRRVKGAALIHLATWPLGLATRRTNPRGIRAVTDLARPDVRLINRESGASARVLLDRLLADVGLAPAAVRGYGDEVHGHDAVARAVALGAADVGLTTQAAAAAHGLAFRQLSEESFNLVITTGEADRPEVQGLLATARTPAFRRDVGALPGYGTARSGQLVSAP
jgi:molybdopterin molybdotransferase/putative molybdopterin biosynthesis protein